MRRGITAAQIEACADWSGEAGANAYRSGEYEDAARLWRQADALRAAALVLRLAKVA